MPRIPVYQSEPILGRGVDPSEMVQGQRSAIRFGAASQDLGEVLGKRAAEIQDDLDSTASVDTFTKYEQASREYKANSIVNRVGKNAVEQNADGSYKLMNEAQKWHNDTMEQFASELSNERQREMFKGLAKKEARVSLDQTLGHIVVQRKEYQNDTRLSSLQSSVDEIALSDGSEAAIQAIKDKHLAKLTAVFGAQNIDDYKLADLSRIDHAALAKRQESQVSSEIAAFEMKHGGDIEAAMQDASSPENTVRLGKQKQDLILSSLNTRLKIADEVYQKDYRKTADNFVLKMASGKLSKADIINSNLRPDDKSKWESHLDTRNRQIRMEANQAKALKADELRAQKEALKNAQNTVLIQTENYIRSGDITDERQIDQIVAVTGLSHEDNSRLKRLYDDSTAAKGQVNFYTMAVEKIDKAFSFPKKEDRSEDQTNTRNQYLATLSHYMAKARLKVNDPAVLDLADKLTEKRQERTPAYNPMQWGVPTRLEEILEGAKTSGSMISLEELGTKLPAKTKR